MKYELYSVTTCRALNRNMQRWDVKNNPSVRTPLPILNIAKYNIIYYIYKS